MKPSSDFRLVCVRTSVVTNSRFNNNYVGPSVIFHSWDGSPLIQKNLWHRIRDELWIFQLRHDRSTKTINQSLFLNFRKLYFTISTTNHETANATTITMQCLPFYGATPWVDIPKLPMRIVNLVVLCRDENWLTCWSSIIWIRTHLFIIAVSWEQKKHGEQEVEQPLSTSKQTYDGRIMMEMRAQMAIENEETLTRLG